MLTLKAGRAVAASGASRTSEAVKYVTRSRRQAGAGLFLQRTAICQPRFPSRSEGERRVGVSDTRWRMAGITCSLFVTIGNEMPVRVLDSVELANRLRPVLLQLSRYLRREAHAEGITGGQASLLAQIARPRRRRSRSGRARGRLRSRDDPLPRPHGESRAGRPDALAEDARRIRLALTPKGVRALRSIRRRRTAWLAERLEGLSAGSWQPMDAAIEPLAGCSRTHE